MATLVDTVEPDGDSLNKTDEITKDSDEALVSDSLNDIVNQPDELNNDSENETEREPISMVEVQMEEENLDETDNDNNPMSLLQIEMEPDDNDEADDIKMEPESNTQMKTEEGLIAGSGSFGEFDVIGQR